MSNPFLCFSIFIHSFFVFLPFPHPRQKTGLLLCPARNIRTVTSCSPVNPSHSHDLSRDAGVSCCLSQLPYNRFIQTLLS